ncbi:MAG: hypothetical protein O9341_13165 [Paucibacter sp.]|nr:hypothetical protein [Roseateles sp.]
MWTGLILLGGSVHAAAPAADCVAAHAQAHASSAGSELKVEAGSESASAQQLFAECALQRYGASAASRVEACGNDLASLPVILLYRVDGLSRSQALADLQREGALSDGSEYAQRAPAMLSFAYQGAAAAKGQGAAWIERRVVEWTDLCLAGRLRFSKPR